MTLGDLIKQFRIEVDDKVGNPFLWDDDEVKLWLNEAQEEAAIRARLIRDKTSPFCLISVLPNVSTYTLDPRIIEIVYANMVYTASPQMFPYVLGRTTSQALDQVRPAWRSLVYRPTAIIHYDTSIEVDCKPDAAYNINLEVYRMPLVQMLTETDSPEIGAIHHRHLVKWAKHRAYEKQDADTQDGTKSAAFLAEFENIFGPRPDASYRKRANGNRPHHNRAYI